MTERNPALWIQARSDHTAENDRHGTVAEIQTGGVVESTGLQVTQNGTPNMSVNVAAGHAFIYGTETATQGCYTVFNDAVLNLAVTASNATNPRIDLVVAKVQDAGYSGATNAWSLAVVAGTPAASPVAPATPNNAIVLAQLAIAANSTTVVTANITDRRTSPVDFPILAQADAITAIALRARAKVSQTATIFQVEDPTGVQPYLQVDAAGKSWAYNGLQVQGLSAATVDLLVKAFASQTANIRETRDSANVLLESLSAAGSLWSTFMQYPNNPTYRNRLINGDMEIWQRGTTAFTATGYTADQWRLSVGAGTHSITRVSLLGGTGYTDRGKYALSWSRTVAGASDSNIQARIENAATLANKTVTISFDAWTASGSVDFHLDVAQVFGTGGSPSSSVSQVGSVQTATTTRTRFTQTFALASVAGKTFGTNDDHYLNMIITRAFNATNGATGTLIFTDVQLEEGPVGTAFERRSQGEELRLCQRYYYRFQAASVNDRIGVGVYTSGTNGSFFWSFPVTMRTAPSLAASNATHFSAVGATSSAASAIATGAGVNVTGAQLNLTVASVTAGQGFIGYFSNASGWLEASAEL